MFHKYVTAGHGLCHASHSNDVQLKRPVSRGFEIRFFFFLKQELFLQEHKKKI